MIQRHKREMTAHKKAMQKLGKGKKDEAAKLTQGMEDRHARELAELDKREAQAPPAPSSLAPAAAAAEADSGVQPLAGLALDHKKPSKAQKRREKLVQEEAARDARIADEHAAQGPTDRAVEEGQLQTLLAPLNLAVRDIRADGHCLYRAIEDQLAQQAPAAGPAGGDGGAGSGGQAAADVQALRALAAAYIRSHADDFMPFIYDEDEGGAPAEQLEAYCAELEGTAAWGGQLELGALAQALQRQIKVYAAGMPAVTLGDEHASNGVLQLCYLRHAFGLGEHYNSVEPAATSSE